jgi:hypothetical protein
MIQKFKTLKEAEKPLWVLNPDNYYYKKIADYFLLIEKLSGIKVSKKITKYKTFKKR